jgi:hypothetical protein
LTRLEVRYRRLLSLYPRAHRTRYGEEMLGVLLAASRSGQQRPGIRDVADLVRGALAARLRSVTGLLAGQWRDAWAVVACVAPLMLSTFAALFAAGFLIRAWVDGTIPWSTQVIVAGAALAWPTVLLLAWTGKRRTAAAVGWSFVVIAIPALLTEGPEWLVLAALSAVAVTVSPGPARGVAILGRLRLVGHALGALLWGTFFVHGVAENLWPEWAMAPAWLAFSLGVVLISASLWSRSLAIQRAALLVAAPLTWVGLSVLRAGGPAVAMPYWLEVTLAATLPAAVFLSALLAHLLHQPRADAVSHGTS